MSQFGRFILKRYASAVAGVCKIVKKERSNTES